MADASTKRRVVITGYGMITPLGRNTCETFEKARNGLSGIDQISAFDTRGLPCRVGGEVKDQWLDSLPRPISARLEKFSSRGLKLMHLATGEAALQARLGDITERRRIGVAIGYHGENPDVADMMLLHRCYSERDGWDLNALAGLAGYSSLNFLRRKPDVGSTLLALLHNCQGSNLSVTSACAARRVPTGASWRAMRGCCRSQAGRSTR